MDAKGYLKESLYLYIKSKFWNQLQHQVHMTVLSTSYISYFLDFYGYAFSKVSISENGIRSVIDGGLLLMLTWSKVDFLPERISFVFCYLGAMPAWNHFKLKSVLKNLSTGLLVWILERFVFTWSSTTTSKFKAYKNVFWSFLNGIFISFYLYSEYVQVYIWVSWKTP